MCNNVRNQFSRIILKLKAPDLGANPLVGVNKIINYDFFAKQSYRVDRLLHLYLPTQVVLRN